jgi:hypothetical protein
VTTSGAAAEVEQMIQERLVIAVEALDHGGIATGAHEALIALAGAATRRAV